MRDALDQLHDEEGAAVGGRAGVEDAGDVGVVHQGQGLALRLEAGQDVPRVHPRLDQLQRHLAADRPELLGEVDRAHAALADLLADLVAIGDDRIDEVRAVVVRSVDGGAVVRRCLPEAARRRIGWRRAHRWLRDRRRAADPGRRAVGRRRPAGRRAGRAARRRRRPRRRGTPGGRRGRPARWPPGTGL